MATYYFRNVGVNWGDAANWSLTSGGGATGAVPTAADDVIFDANSGNCTVNASNRVCLTINFTNYTNTITMTFAIQVSGNITLGASMGVGGTGALIFQNVSATYTANGFTWPNEIRFISTTTTKTYTFASDCSFSGLFNNLGGSNNISTAFAGGRTITCSGGLTTPQTNTSFIGSGSATTFKVTGGNFSGTYGTLINITLDGGANTITFTGNVGFGASTSGGTFLYTSGIISGSTLRTLTLIGGTYTLGTNVKWGAISNSSGGGAITLSDDLYCEGTFTHNGTQNYITSTSKSIYTWSYTGFSNTGDPQGVGTKPKLIFNGTGTISYHGNNAWVIEFNTDGIVTYTSTSSSGIIFAIGSAGVNGGLNWIKGEVSFTTSSIIRLLKGTINMPGILMNSVILGSNVSGINLTITSDLMITNLTASSTTQISLLGTFTIFVFNNLTISDVGALTADATGKIVLCGSGTWSQTAGNNNFSANLEIDTLGTITISGTVYKLGNLTYTKGRIINRSSTLVIPGSSAGYYNLHRMPFDAVSILSGATITMNEFFTGRPGKYCRITSTGATNYFINFYDNFEKFSRFTLPSNMTINQRGQLRMLNSKGNRNSNSLGLIYFEGAQPYGIPHNNPSSAQVPYYGVADNPADPNFF
jgi:hypothetical protein